MCLSMRREPWLGRRRDGGGLYVDGGMDLESP